jgi:hypothetical protein
VPGTVRIGGAAPGVGLVRVDGSAHTRNVHGAVPVVRDRCALLVAVHHVDDLHAAASRRPVRDHEQVAVEVRVRLGPDDRFIPVEDDRAALFLAMLRVAVLVGAEVAVVVVGPQYLLAVGRELHREHVRRVGLELLARSGDVDVTGIVERDRLALLVEIDELVRIGVAGVLRVGRVSPGPEARVRGAVRPVLRHDEVVARGGARGADDVQAPVAAARDRVAVADQAAGGAGGCAARFPGRCERGGGAGHGQRDESEYGRAH